MRLTMNQKFTVEEIKDAARTARIHCPGFSEDKFESLMELESRIADSGFLEAIQGLLRLEEEKNISCAEALDACKELLEQKTKLEQEVPALEKRVDSLVAQIRQATGEYEQIKKATPKAGQELAQIRNEYVVAEKKLKTFNKRMENEKQRIGKEVEDCYQQANVTREEVVTAGRIKADVENHGFTLELVLDLSKEFAGHKDARKELAKGIKEHGSLNKYLYNLADWGNKERARIIAEIADLESQKKALSGESSHLRTVLSELQADVANEEELRRFYSRYWRMSVLIEELISWDRIFFVRCDNPFFKFTSIADHRSDNARFWTDKEPVMCPQCGYRQLLYDEKIYRALNWPVGAPFGLKPE
jgi:chromosome segregation ATPase